MQISPDRYAFLMYVLFGSEKNPYIASSKTAYRDLCRTLRLTPEGGEKYRMHIDLMLERRVRDILSRENVGQRAYDAWHHAVCDEIVSHYTENKVVFTIGQAQKWLNMVMKYLYIRGDTDIERVLPWLHAPLDQYVFRAADKELHIKHPCAAWSKLDDYGIYLAYQKQVHSAAKKPPLLWEIEAWLTEATQPA